MRIHAALALLMLTQPAKCPGLYTVPTEPLPYTGAMQIDVTAPDGVVPQIMLYGPGNDWQVTGSTTLTSIPSGTYLLHAFPVVVDSTTYVATPVEQNAYVYSSGAPATVAVTYAKD